MRHAEAIDIRADVELHTVDVVAERLEVAVIEVTRWARASAGVPVPWWVMVDADGLCIVGEDL